MIVPNKAIPYSTSLLSKLPHLVKTIKDENTINVLELYYAVHEDYSDVSQFVMALETLYSLRKINLNNGEIIDVA